MPIQEANPSDVNNLEKLKEKMAKYHEKLIQIFMKQAGTIKEKFWKEGKEN